MGSFNTTCSISDLTIISGDEIYIQLMLPTWVINPHSIDAEKVGCGEKGIRISNEGSMGEFVPFGFPIYMDYNDSGDGDVNIRDHNIEMLEDFFGIPIDKIIEYASNYNWYKYTYKPAIEENRDDEYKGQYDKWLINNKSNIKHIDILKKLTLTFFKKEHYDFLSKKMHGGDDYYNSEREKRLVEMLNSLKELDLKRPKNGEFKFFTKDDITDELRTQCEDLFNEPMTDDEIIIMQNIDTRQWWSNFQHTFYIPQISDYNMFNLLPIGEKDTDNVKKHFYFFSNMYNLRKVLRPSYYGSQDDNYDAYVEYHKMSTELISNKKVKEKEDTILYEIRDVLINSLSQIKDKKLIQQIKDDIIEELDVYGYKIKF